jgi:hypothetical protein
MTTQHALPCNGCQLRFASRSELTRHRREAHRPARPPALVRLARVLRAMHQEQVYAMECLLRVNQPLQAGLLTWIRTLRGYRLAGRYLPPRPGQPSRHSTADPRRDSRKPL